MNYLFINSELIVVIIVVIVGLLHFLTGIQSLGEIYKNIKHVIMKYQLKQVLHLILPFAIFISFQPIFAQSKADQINELLNRYYEFGEFNGCVLVAEDGQIIYQKALGFADVDHNEPLSLNHGFRLASVSKQFTAMAVMILQERGELDYEDDIRQYIPELPYKDITIRNLLTHTSGLPDYGSLLEEYWDTAHKGLPERRIASNKDALKLLIEKHPPLKFKAGESQVYCNTGYMLLALIVERISGESFQNFMKINIFQPLGMSHTFVNESSGILPDNQRAHGFKPNPEGTGFISNDHHYQNGMYGDGGIISTVKDIFAWDQALYTEELVRRTTLAEAFTPVMLNDSSAVNYGFGWSIIPAEEGTILAHGGGWLGFQTFILRDITFRNTVILLCNVPGIRKDELAFTIYNILHDRKYALPVKGHVIFKVDMRVPMQHHIFEPLNGDAVVLRGSFNDWKGNKEILKDIDRDSIYQITHNVIGTEGDTIEYKFVIHKSNDTDFWEQNPDTSNANYGNRRIILTENPQTLSAAKFAVDRYKLNYQGNFSVRELQQDFRQMRKALEESHPALYDYTNKKTLDSLFNHYYQQILPGMGFNDFHKVLSAVLAPIGCGHTKLWIPSDYWDNVPQRFFPLKLLFNTNKVLVSGYYFPANHVPLGSEIVSINDLPIREVINTLESITSSDGFIQAFKSKSVEKNFSQKYALYYGYPNIFRVEYIPPSEFKTRVAELYPLGIEAINMHPTRGNELSLKLLQESDAALLTINTFAYYDRLEMFKSFMDSAFQVIRHEKINNLIIDLRGNDGGDPFCSSYLLSYLEYEPVPYFAEPYGKYADLAKPIPRAQNHFKGNLYTLIDGGGFSTTGHFCALLKYHNIGKMVGTETGATYTCTGSVRYLNLKNSRLILGTAQKRRYSAAVQNMDRTRGVIPDYWVEPSQKDLIEGKDTILNFVLKLMEKTDE